MVITCCCLPTTSCGIVVVQHNLSVAGPEFDSIGIVHFNEQSHAAGFHHCWLAQNTRNQVPFAEGREDGNNLVCIWLSPLVWWWSSPKYCFVLSWMLYSDTSLLYNNILCYIDTYFAYSHNMCDLIALVIH